MVGASWCVGIGLAVLTTITLIGWIAAPRAALGPGLAGVFRTAVNFWLVAHHAGFSLQDGRVGLLPIGLMVLPGALLYRSGGWMIRSIEPRRPPRAMVMRVAVALAAPYALLAGALALAASTSVVRPSAWQALFACFVLAVCAGALGAARAVVAARGPRVRSGLGALLRLLPDRPRSLATGVAASTAVLLASGALLVGAALAMNFAEARTLYDALAPGLVGGPLLLLVEIVFLPNAVIWGMAYAIGPGFAVGSATSVSPTGVILDVVPSFPPLAALPETGPAPALSLFALAAPFVAGAVGGVLTVRALPSPVYEAAPLWGFVSGALTGCVTAVLAALSGGPLGGGRLATMGPSAWQVGLLAALEVGVSAAIAAWVANWRMLRTSGKEPRPRRRWRRARAGAPAAPDPAEMAAAVPAEGAGAPAGRTAGRTAGGGRRRWRRAPRPPAAPAGGRADRPAPPAARPDTPRRPVPQPGASVEFEEAEPILGARRPPRRSVPRRPDEPAADWIEPVPAPAPAPDQDPGPEPAPAPEPEPADETPEPVPPPSDEPARTENKGGAIYVLREESED
ncbi:hypothetical protein DPM19_10085 [Actinomadura craniellae]|uniref:Integral membrane protein n=1 Tax=Actinomadura craniellae TaxID=2231787 RepID=A0A365H8V8_9ACTN|nr:hypothetical protein DPM19_10085 [Actinomadura craniellae]